MKKILSIVALTTLATSAYSYDYGYGSQNDSKRGYESSFGNKYEYDLSNPSDRIRYEIDPAAQLMDSIDVNPTRELERGLGQYGAGVYRD